MPKAGRFAVSAPLFAAGALLVLYGLFALVYGGDAHSGPTRVTLAGRQVDAHLAGGASLGLGLGLLATVTLETRRRRRDRGIRSGGAS